MPADGRSPILAVMMTTPGRPYPLGATPRAGGVNFAVASRVADGIEVCLFDEAGNEQRVPLTERDADVWHTFVAGVGPGQRYGLRAGGPWDPGRGVRCNPAKLLLDPYARATTGAVRFGPELFGHALDAPDSPSATDSAGHVPLSVVVDGDFDWGADTRPDRPYADTVIYEIHVKGDRKSVV